MAIRDEIVWRSGIVYFAIAILAAALLVRILILQTVQRGKWTDMSEKFVYKTAEVPANRGDILTHDGRLLASSVPYYTIYMDTRSTGMSGATWSNGINGLSAGLARLVGERSAAGWKSAITEARRKGDRYFLIKRKVNYETLKKLKEIAENEKYYTDIKPEIELLESKLMHNKDEDIVKHRDEISEVLKSEIVSRYYYQKGRIKASLESDPAITKAIGLIGEKQNYTSILSGKSQNPSKMN